MPGQHGQSCGPDPDGLIRATARTGPRLQLADRQRIVLEDCGELPHHALLAAGAHPVAGQDRSPARIVAVSLWALAAARGADHAEGFRSGFALVAGHAPGTSPEGAAKSNVIGSFQRTMQAGSSCGPVWPRSSQQWGHSPMPPQVPPWCARQASYSLATSVRLHGATAVQTARSP